jgi:phasin family protein
VPGVDTKALLESHDRNIEALTRATEVATEGAAAVYRRQQEIMQAAGEQLSAMVRDIKLGTEQQAEVAKKVFEQALANARELAEMSAKANQDAYEVMKKRLQTSIEEMKAVFASSRARETGAHNRTKRGPPCRRSSVRLVHPLELNPGV